jgi:class 3 adenylate cyclase
MRPATTPPTLAFLERRRVTALFADIKRSRELEQDLDPEKARAIIGPALKLMMEAVRRYDGHVVRFTDGGVFALFGAPVTHEDHPKRALYAALCAQDDLRRYAEKLREQGQAPLSVRVGIDIGEVVLRFTPTGDTSVESARIEQSARGVQTLAASGSVVIGASVRDLVEGYFQLKPLGAPKVTRVGHGLKVYEVTGLRPPLNPPAAQTPPVLFKESAPKESESTGARKTGALVVPSRPSRYRNLAAFLGITVLVLVSLAILYQGGAADNIRSLLETVF